VTVYPSANTLFLLAILFVVGLMLFLILYCKIHAFFALLFSSLTLGLLTGMPPHAIVTSFQKGIGELLGATSTIIAVGAVMGRLIEISGGGDVIAQTMIRLLGDKRIPWAILVFAYLIGIPVFFDVAFITFVPLVWNISKATQKSLLLYVLPLLSGLMTSFALIPTNPGPAAASQLLGADLGKTVLCGLVIALPMAIAGGIFYGGWIAKRMFVRVPENLMPKVEHTDQTENRRPSFQAVLAVVLLPIVLIGSGVLVPLQFPAGSRIAVWAKFIGYPPIALLSATALALIVLGLRLGFTPAALMQHTTGALNSIGSLILIIGASGAFKQIVVDSGVGNSIVNFIVSTKIPPLLMAYLVAAVLRIAFGSTAAAIATAGGIVAPIVTYFPNVNHSLMVMAVATGGSIFAYVNDGGFWMVKVYCGMSVSQTLKSYSMMKLVTSVTGFVALWIISQFV
jgi:Gnt-I system low-affinity gluconate transporter